MKKEVSIILLTLFIFIAGCGSEEITKSSPVIEQKEELQQHNQTEELTTEERVAEAYENLHKPGSSKHIIENFPDIELVFTDEGNELFPQEILPFKHYYSKEANKTFNLCNIGRTVFICDGKIEKPISQEHINTGRCVVTPEYVIEEQHTKQKEGLLSGPECKEEGPSKLTHPPIALKNLLKIVPMGKMSTSHITPTDHQYWHTVDYFGPEDDTKNLDRFEVYAPADGTIVDIEKGTDYRIVIEHSCTLYTIFIHVDKLTEKIENKVNFKDDTSREHAWPRIQVKAGEVIGTIGIGKLDFSVVDADVTLQGFVNPDAYNERWKIHTVNTFEYYEEPVRSKLLEKNLRREKPLGGKIDYDVEGTLSGNWFVKDTNHYRGNKKPYWSTHLSVVYDAFDPEHIVISIGEFYEDRGDQFGVKSNSPDPRKVNVQTGLVKYELTPYDHYTNGQQWDQIKYAENIKAKNREEIRGVALFRLIDTDTLKAEFFPEKTGSEVEGFTSNAKIYER